MAGKAKASVILAHRGRRFVMVRHGERAWEFPGGMTRKGETNLSAAKRELKEETGLKGKQWKDLGIVKDDLALFACQASGKIQPKAKEIAEARWFNVPPASLSFPRDEVFEFLQISGRKGKTRVDYDKAADYFDDVRVSRPEHIGTWAENLIKWGRIEKASRVFDVGCGTGRYTFGLAEKTGAEVWGLDASKGMLMKACGKRPGRWIRGDASALPAPSETFDTVILMLVLQHVDDEVKTLLEAFRTLKQGGRLVIVTVSHGRIRRHLMRHFPGMVKLDLDRFMPLPELKWHLGMTGFQNVHSHRIVTKGPDTNVDELVERFRKRYISTLVLLPKDEFEKGLKVFEERVRKLYKDEIEYLIDLTFVEAQKP
jgi:ubiquinone/menaquinone biosynthesis C-methylase UbiE/ADP-ribose pyrophosphatase YjhB (NUDIX family)